MTASAVEYPQVREWVTAMLGKTQATVSGGVSADYDGTMNPYGQAGVYVRF